MDYSPEPPESPCQRAKTTTWQSEPGSAGHICFTLPSFLSHKQDFTAGGDSSRDARTFTHTTLWAVSHPAFPDRVFPRTGAILQLSHAPILWQPNLTH